MARAARLGRRGAPPEASRSGAERRRRRLGGRGPKRALMGFSFWHYRSHFARFDPFMQGFGGQNSSKSRPTKSASDRLWGNIIQDS